MVEYFAVSVEFMVSSWRNFFRSYVGMADRPPDLEYGQPEVG